MSLYSYLNRESIVINKLIAFTQTPKFATIMELLMKSDVITDNNDWDLRAQMERPKSQFITQKLLSLLIRVNN